VIKKSKPGKRRAGKPPSDNLATFEKELRKTSVTERYLLCLYITGTTQLSTRAIANIRALCEEFLKGRYKLDVVDIYQSPLETINAQIVAAPTLIKKLPLPVKRLIGDLSDRKKLILGLDLHLQAGVANAGVKTFVTRL